MKGNLATFQTKLEDFATKYKKKINDNPLFRTQFQEMCQAIGVDPLACAFFCDLSKMARVQPIFTSFFDTSQIMISHGGCVVRDMKVVILLLQCCSGKMCDLGELNFSVIIEDCLF